MDNYARLASCRRERRKRKYVGLMEYLASILTIILKEVDPFASSEDNVKDPGAQQAGTIAPEGTDSATAQSQGQNTDRVKTIG